MGTLALTVLLGALIPGALLYRLPLANRDRRAQRPADERLFWAILLSVTWTVGLVILLAAFDAYTLRRVWWINGTLSAAMLVLGRGRLRYRGTAAPFSWHGLAPAALIGLAVWLYFPTFDYVMGGRDPGVYLSEGVQIAKRGGLFIDDPTVAAVPEESRRLFFRRITDRIGYAVRFPGFLIGPSAPDTVLGQFPHWFPASIALAYDTAGLDAAKATVGVWAGLGLLAVYFAVTGWFGRLAGALSGGLLAIHVLQVWFGRYPNAELSSQAMLFGSLLAFTLATSGDRVFFGTIAGLLAGLQLFARVDAVLVVGALAATAGLLLVVRRGAGWPFLAALGGSSLLALWYLFAPMAHYSETYFGTVHYGGGWWILGGLAAVAVAYLVVVRLEIVRRSLERWLPAALAVTLVVLATYGWFFREPTDPTAQGAVGNAYAFRQFGWYLTTAGTAVAVAAFVVLVLRRFWQEPALYVTTAAYALFIFYKPRIYPEHFWMGRRFLPILLPAAIVAIVAAVTWLLSARMRRPWAAAGLAVLLVAPLGWAFWVQATPVRAHVEYAGLQREIERRFVNRVGPRDLLLIESRDADTDLHVLGPPLAYLYDRPVLLLESERPNQRALEAFLAAAETRYDRVFFLGGGGTDLLSLHIEAAPVTDGQFRIPEYQSLANVYPTEVRAKDFDYSIYRLSRAKTPRPRGPIDLTIGRLDDLHVLRFFAKERMGDGTPFRWTKNNGSIMLLGMAAEARELTVWMSSGGRHPAAQPALVRVTIDGRVLGDALVIDGVHPYRFVVPPEVVAAASQSPDPVALTLTVPPWNPRTIMQAPDSRDLGVIVTRVQVQ